MAFSESPSIVVREVDLSGVVPSVSSSTGAIVGNFSWGPVHTPRKIDNEATLVAEFGAPENYNSVDFHSAAYFLKYGNSLQVVRIIDSSGANAYTGGVGGPDAPVVKSIDNFDKSAAALESDGFDFIAKYPGNLGNGIQIQICPQQSNDSAYDNWTLKDNFDAAPGTSDYATKRNALNDEVHVAVIDRLGKFTGTVGQVLETFPFVSLAQDAKAADGASIYIKDVLNQRSGYVFLSTFDSAFDTAGAGDDADSGENFALAAPQVKTYNLANGEASATAGKVGRILRGFDEFEDKDNIQVDMLIAPDTAGRTDHVAIVNDLVSIAEARKDCVVVASPNKNAVNNKNFVTETVTTAQSYTTSSYLFADNNYFKIYDKYNDKFIEIPAASSTAGLMASTDFVAAPWFSPAGPRRGRYLGVVNAVRSPTKSQRDTLYRESVNPIANIPGQGLLLFGDKTKMNRPSAFDRINVRRLFLVIERAIAIAARNVMFEFNDEFTRSEFVGIVEPFLREIKGRRGITDFRVICDETNNTAAVIDRNEFIANILIKPARSINFVTLNFVAVRTGVDFEEIAGNVA